MSCGVGCRRGLDSALLWLWCRPAAVAPLRPLAWEPPYAVGEALKKKKKEKEVGDVFRVLLPRKYTLNKENGIQYIHQ